MLVEENIKLLIADESRLHCQLLATALRRSGYPFTIVGSAIEQSEVRTCLDSEVNVAIIGVHLKDGKNAGLRMTREIRTNHPKTDVVMLLSSNGQEEIIQAFQAGASGVLWKDESFEVLCKCIHVVSQGQVWANSKELRYLLDALVQNRSISVGSAKISTPSNSLTRREAGVVDLVAEGLTNRDISRHLNLSEHTVRNYLFRIYNKLGTSNRLELALYVIHRRKSDPGRSAV